MSNSTLYRYAYVLEIWTIGATIGKYYGSVFAVDHNAARDKIIPLYPETERYSYSIGIERKQV